jgi:hypothetical protein
MNKSKQYAKSILSFMHAIYDLKVKEGETPANAKYIAYDEMFKFFLAFIKNEKELVEHTLYLFGDFYNKISNEVGKKHSQELKSFIESKDISNIEKTKLKINQIKDLKDSLDLFLSSYYPEKTQKKD